MKHITKEAWNGFFNRTAEPGDTVDQEIIHEMLNAQPPARVGDGYLQPGGVCARISDGKGRNRPTYMTFQKTQAGVWVYRGTCFLGETTHHPETGDPWNGN